jgi:hypothetical protein
MDKVNSDQKVGEQTIEILLETFFEEFPEQTNRQTFFQTLTKNSRQQNEFLPK